MERRINICVCVGKIDTVDREKERKRESADREREVENSVYLKRKESRGLHYEYFGLCAPFL